MTIEIMNLKDSFLIEPYDVRIDRGTPLGNPFNMEMEDHRDIVCDEYEIMLKHFIRNDIKSKVDELDRLKALYKEHGKLRLFC